jgi:Rad3-related DNA helicase
MSIYSPQSLGFPEFFDSFRDAQDEAIDYTLTCEKRFCAIGAPPGVGKSGIAFALAKLFGGRTIILTSNKGLEQQYCNTFGPAGLVNIHGRNNYQCWEGGSCEDGGRLGCKDHGGCPYKGAFAVQQASNIVITNYAYWIAVGKVGGLRAPDTLICDEFGLAFEWLSRALDFTISERECTSAGVRWTPPPGEDVEDWMTRAPRIAAAAEAHLIKVRARLTPTNRHTLAKELKHAEGFVDRARQLMRIDPSNFVCTRDDGTDWGRQWRFECVWPGKYKEMLFRSIPRVILLSATLRPKTLQLNGIPRSECDFKEWPRQFPPANGPVVWVPTAKVKHGWSGEDEQRWLERHAEILAWGGDRKGLVHTVSYARAKRIGEYLSEQHGRNIILNGAADPESATATQAFEKFKCSPDGTALISPSFSTGWDFHGRLAEWQIISKIAFPDSRGKVMQARTEADKTYPIYVAGQELAQGSGRVVRSEVDRGATVIVDDSWKWFRHMVSEFIPRWFGVRKEDHLPKPMKRAPED